MNSDEKLTQWWIRPAIRQLSAYHVADAEGMVKLDAMENPYPWPEGLKRRWLNQVENIDVNRYPDPSARNLTQAIRRSMKVPHDMGVILGNGSDELIQIIAMALAGDDRCLMSVEPGFVMYKMIAEFCRMQYVGVALKESDFSLDLDAMLQAIEQNQPAVIFLAYPNNPTGNLFDRDSINAIIEASPGVVVIDEAYAPFTSESYMNELGKYPNLLVMRTVSKMGLAGLRLGLLVGPNAWLDEFDKVRLPYNINVLTQITAQLSLENHVVFDHQTRLIRESRACLMKALSVIDGFKVYPSEANFVLIRTTQGLATSIFDALKQKGILIKNLDGAHPYLKDCLRVTVGTDGENRQLLEALEEIL